jgi:hypothetical protein
MFFFICDRFAVKMVRRSYKQNHNGHFTVTNVKTFLKNQVTVLIL